MSNLGIDPKIIHITKKVGQYLLSQYGDLVSEHRVEDNHFGIPHDDIASGMYKEFLTENFPDVDFYSESEKNNVGQDRPYWIIDPLEGTTNYAHGIPFFATQIGLVQDGKVTVSCIYVPLEDKVYTAALGSGAYCNGKRLVAKSSSTLAEATVSLGKCSNNIGLKLWTETIHKVIPHVRTVRHLGATGIDICYTISGKFDLHINHHSQNYDYAPGVLIAREAGLVAANFEGQDFTLTDRNLILGERSLVEQVQKILRS